MGKLLKWYLKGKTCRKLANGQDIDYSEEKKWPKGFICPYTGTSLFSIIFKHVYWYIQQISGERLQDQWSSGYDYEKNYPMGLFSPHLGAIFMYMAIFKHVYWFVY